VVVRQFCKCSTCGQAHTLRISVGYNPYQEHTFYCAGCNEAIVIGMKVNLQDMSSFPMEYINNCQASTEEGQIINLHPHFAIPEDQLHTDRAFP
jgi:hypothetical protein